MSRIGYEIITSDVELETQSRLRYRPVIKRQPKRDPYTTSNAIHAHKVTQIAHDQLKHPARTIIYDWTNFIFHRPSGS